MRVYSKPKGVSVRFSNKVFILESLATKVLKIQEALSISPVAGKIHLATTVSGESSVSENRAPDALENGEINRILNDPDDEKMTQILTEQQSKTNAT